MDGLTESQKNPPALDVFTGGGEMGELMRRKDWSLCALAPLENWSPSLKTALRIILGSRYPMFIWWGHQFINFYNDAYIPMLGQHHPAALGQSACDVWADVWDIVGPQAEAVLNKGEASWNKELLMIMERNGYLEETYFTFSYSPIADDDGSPGGVFCAVTEETERVLADRRLRTLRELGTEMAKANTVEEACRFAANVFTNNPYDIPFALIYRLDHESKQVRLVSTTNSDTIAIAQASERFNQWLQNQGLATDESRVIENEEEQFGALPGGAWSQPPKQAVVLPLHRSGQETFGFLIAGVSPYRLLDEDYRGFFNVIAGQVTTAIATVRAYEEERASAVSEAARSAALTALDRAKILFFSNISHEFRTPLTLMLSPLEDILALPDDEPIANHRQSLERVHRNGLRLLKLVNTLLDFSRIEAGRVQAVYEPTDLAKFTAELASVFRSAIERAGLTLIVDCPSDFSRHVEKDLTPQPPSVNKNLSPYSSPLVGENERGGKGENSKPLSWQERGLERGFPEPVKRNERNDSTPLSEPVYVDRDMWEKIVLNLLSNAFKFTFAGEIAVRLRQVNNHAELTVQDTGVGVPVAESPRLFERFHRVSDTRSRSYEGSGIGLSLVQELVKLHGGTIEVSSQVDVGTTFTVAIPLGKTHLSSVSVARRDREPRLWHEAATPTLQSTATAANPFVEEALRWLPEEEEQGERRSRGREELMDVNSVASPASPASPARILLVDDNADMRDYVQRLLSKRWQVKAVENGAVALGLMQEWMPDLILSDVMMPELDGFGLLQAIRANPHTQGIPVILLSARAGEESEIEGLEAGADDYLIKPFSARELMTRVNTNLQMARLRQEQSANRLKDEFLATVTHELNAPLAAILTWARLLQTKPFDRPMMLRALETIERNANNQAKLIEDLLDVSSILASKRGLNLQPVDLVSIINDVINTLYPTAQAKAIALRYGISEEDTGTRGHGDAGMLEKGSPCPLVHSNFKTQNSQLTVSGEPKRLRQIITNLLSNAIKFTPSGGKIAIQLSLVSGQSSVASGQDQQQTPNNKQLTTNKFARIQIKDTGIGISADFLPYVFDRFSQAEVPSRHSPGGVGIGLAIARLLVELHGGTIEVASVGEGRGATFTVRLPLIQWSRTQR
ncbi:MAG TPA: ATP-binding protein [Stenomitos sp.]